MEQNPQSGIIQRLEQYKPITSEAQHAVGEAMTMAPFLLSYTEIKIADEQRTGESLASIYNRTTDHSCAPSSVMTIFLLQRYHPHLFKKMILVSGTNDLSKPGKERSLKPLDRRDEEAVINHVGFLVEDNNANFYFGSSSNHYSNKDDHFTELITADNLEELMEEIVSSNGGTWPSAQRIQNRLNSFAYTHPKIIEVKPNVYDMGTYGVFNVSDKEDHRMKEYETYGNDRFFEQENGIFTLPDTQQLKHVKSWRNFFPLVRLELGNLAKNFAT